MRKCLHCGSEEIIFVDGYMYICEKCARVQPYTHYVNEVDNRKTYHMRRRTPYQCTTYFKRILRCLQCKSLSNIPKYVIDMIKDNPDIDVRTLLRDKKLFHYYIYIPELSYYYRNIKPIHLTYEEEDKLIKLFNNVEKQIRKLNPGCSQILRYRQILKKLLIKIGREDISELIPELRTKRGKKEFDEKWKLVEI